MSTALRIAYTISWSPKEISDGTFIWNNETLYLHGSGVSVILDIAESLNLKVETYFGDNIETLCLVANGTPDMGGLLTSQDYQLNETLAYLHPLDCETSDVYFKQPPPDSAVYTIIRPFSKNLWIVLTLLMLMVSMLSRKRSKQSTLVTICKTIIHAVELLVDRHDVHFPLKKVPVSVTLSRLIVAFFGVIICSAYVGKIASTFVIREDLVKTPNDLIKYNCKLNTYSKIHVQRVFENSERNVTANVIILADYLSYITNVIGEPNADPRETLFSYADGFLPPALYTLNYNHELCTISVLKSTRKTPRSFYIRKDSLLREDINLKIVQLVERGINFRHQVNFKKRFDYRCLKQDTEFNQLTFKYVALAFIFLYAGIFLAFLLDLIMHFMLRVKNSTRVQQNKTKCAIPRTSVFLIKPKLNHRLYDLKSIA